MVDKFRLVGKIDVQYTLLTGLGAPRNRAARHKRHSDTERNARHLESNLRPRGGNK